MLPSSHRVTGGGHPPWVGERGINAAEAEIVRRIFRESPPAGRRARSRWPSTARVSPDRLAAPGAATPPSAATRPSRTVASAPQQVEHSQQVVG
jgi:hypothetical protein